MDSVALAFGYERYFHSLCGWDWLLPLRGVSFCERAKVEGSDSSTPERHSNTLREGRGDTMRLYQKGSRRGRRGMLSSHGYEGGPRRGPVEGIGTRGAWKRGSSFAGTVGRRGGRPGTERELRKPRRRRICE